MIRFEFLIFLGLGLALGIQQLVSIRRDIRRARENPLDVIPRPEHKAPDRDPRGP